jgi:hypothetical protein
MSLFTRVRARAGRFFGSLVREAQLGAPRLDGALRSSRR